MGRKVKWRYFFTAPTPSLMKQYIDSTKKVDMVSKVKWRKKNTAPQLREANTFLVIIKKVDIVSRSSENVFFSTPNPFPYKTIRW